MRTLVMLLGIFTLIGTSAYSQDDKVEILCPYCDKTSNVQPLDKTFYKIYPIEFQEILLCLHCSARRVDGVWYTKEEWDNKLKEARAERDVNIKNARIEKWRSYGWTEKRIKRVLEGYIYIGDTPEIVREAWGEPEEINRTITAYGTHEQWVYDLGCYVYFDNGKVTAIQD